MRKRTTESVLMAIRDNAMVSSPTLVIFSTIHNLKINIRRNKIAWLKWIVFVIEPNIYYEVIVNRHYIHVISSFKALKCRCKLKCKVINNLSLNRNNTCFQFAKYFGNATTFHLGLCAILELTRTDFVRFHMEWLLRYPGWFLIDYLDTIYDYDIFKCLRISPSNTNLYLTPIAIQISDSFHTFHGQKVKNRKIKIKFHQIKKNELNLFILNYFSIS